MDAVRAKEEGGDLCPGFQMYAGGAGQVEKPWPTPEDTTGQVHRDSQLLKPPSELTLPLWHCVLTYVCTHEQACDARHLVSHRGQKMSTPSRPTRPSTRATSVRGKPGPAPVSCSGTLPQPRLLEEPMTVMGLGGKAGCAVMQCFHPASPPPLSPATAAAWIPLPPEDP